MSYSRQIETGTYIWSDGENLHFDLDEIPESKINIFLAKVYKERPKELVDRVKIGENLIKKFKEGNNIEKNI